jgi:GDP-L-fucose synthase
MKPSDKIYIAGHRGMVGGAICRSLVHQGYSNLVFKTSQALDLRRQEPTEAFLEAEKPDVVIVCAAKVGGIHANSTYPAEFLFENLAIASNVIHGAYRAGVKRLLFLGSACIYPKMAPQPITEDALLTSALEITNEAYAIAKIAGMKLCQFYRQQYGVMYHSAMPNNLYGIGDNYHPTGSHVIPGLIRRFHQAKLDNAPEVVMWGTGKPLREFVFSEDLADAIVHLLQMESPPDWVNIGYGSDISIGELAHLIAETVGYQGKIVNDLTKPDGTPRKLLASSLINECGWQPKVDLRTGLKLAYQDFCSLLDRGLLRS